MLSDVKEVTRLTCWRVPGIAGEEEGCTSAWMVREGFSEEAVYERRSLQIAGEDRGVAGTEGQLGGGTEAEHGE